MEIEERLKNVYRIELEKIKESVEDSIRSGNSRGITQKIGRRFGYLWEVLVKETIDCTGPGKLGKKILYKEYVDEWININVRNEFDDSFTDTFESLLKKFIAEDTDIEKQGLCDFTLNENDIIYAIDTKFSLSSNDSAKLKLIANCGRQLNFLGYEPVLLFRTNNIRGTTYNRFKDNGWNIIGGKDASNWILKKTGFNIEKWIDDNVDVWEDLKDYHIELTKLKTIEEHWKF